MPTPTTTTGAPGADSPPNAPTFDLNDPTSFPDPETAGGPKDEVALCLSGGGYRAMLFHVGALWRLNEAALLKRLARVSSVSGGSITAGVLGLHWRELRFDAKGVVQNLDLVFDKVGDFAGRTVDEGSVLSGLLLPGTIADKVAAAYDRHLFKGRTLRDLPGPGEGPTFVINATNVQSGAVWRFTREYMGDWRVGRIPGPRVALSRAVAASSAFPPVLSPLTLDLDPGEFTLRDGADLADDKFRDNVVLSDGGVYDNLGLETAFKRCRVLLVSDAGQKMSPEADPAGDWARHSVRVMGLLDNQVRNLRKRQLIDAYTRDPKHRDARAGTYWGIRSHFRDYAVTDPLGVGTDAASDRMTEALAAVKTRLKAMPKDVQRRLINWGYAICDTGLRAYVEPGLSQSGLPYPAREM